MDCKWKWLIDNQPVSSSVWWRPDSGSKWAIVRQALPGPASPNNRCSRWKPSYTVYGFRLEGLSNFSLLVPRRQSTNIGMKCKTQTAVSLLVHEFYMVHVFGTMWRVKNRPPNSTSCCDSALRLLVLVVGKLYRGLQVTYSLLSIWSCVLKGCFERDIVWRAKPHLKGIEGFDLEHCQWCTYFGTGEQWMGVLTVSKGLFRLGARAIGNKSQYVPCGMQMAPQGH